MALLVDDRRGGACSLARVEHALLVNAPPRAAAGADRVVAAGESFVLDGSASADPDGAITRFQWDFGDGTLGDALEVSHRYARPGDYEVELTVTDDTDLPNSQDRDRLRIKTHAAPIPRVALDPAGTLSWRGCPLRCQWFRAIPDGTPTNWIWSFGDGDVKAGKTLTHRYGYPGRYGLSLAIVDDSKAANATSLLT